MEATIVIVKRSREPVKPWRVEIRAINRVQPPPEVVDKECDTFDEAVEAARKFMTYLDQVAKDDGVSRRDYYKIAIIEV